MKAVEANLLKFIQSGEQFAIPIYQRTYSWQLPECEQLWQDIIRSASDSSIIGHFVGSVVYIQEGQSNIGHWAPYLVIDGQQRLTTVSLILAALAEALGDSETSDGFTARKIRNLFLTNPEESGERRFKLILSQTDKSSLCAIVSQAPMPHETSIRITANYEFFLKRLKDSHELRNLVWAGLAKLMIVDVSLTRGVDNPQLVFESLNSTGRELSQADLIRNYVLMSLKPDLQTRLYESYWRPMEVEFGQEGYLSAFDAFMRDYLTYRTRELPNIGNVYEAFKKFAKGRDGADVEPLLADLRKVSRFYCAMALGRETDSRLKGAFHDLKELKVDVAYPLLLELYEDYADGTLEKSDFLQAIRWIESYVFRRSVCAIPTNSMNKTFTTFGRDLDKSRYLESFQETFLLLPSYRRFPRDDEFRRELMSRDLYNFRSRSYWLKKLETFDRKEPILMKELTIEHILPQCDNDAAKVPMTWRTMLGDDWLRVWETYRHSLGNLTLTAYNSEYSNKPFLEKRNMEKGFKDSPLKLNSMLRNLEEWTEKEILDRGEMLSKLALQVWTAPQGDPAALGTLRKVKAATGLRLEDFSSLTGGPMRELFDALEREILAIDPVVYRVINKSYIAFKAETNFVDIHPQQRRLWLIIDVPLAELDDPEGLAEDIEQFGWTGNGDVRVSITSLDEIPYAMSLVRQAFDRQMGEIVS